VSLRAFLRSFAEEIGVGGLDHVFDDLFRRILTPRLLPTDVKAALGLRQARGVVLYGPPGTGKTMVLDPPPLPLLATPEVERWQACLWSSLGVPLSDPPPLQVARTLSGLLTTRRPKLIAGPEVFNHLLGSSEQKVRDLFKPAEEEWKRKKDAALLHVIIIDEIDALARSRGGGSSGGDGSGGGGAHRDSVVNQLLAKIDGLEQQNNVLVIGTTNRLDMIDPAVSLIRA
jgi:vesicle-fusing ATPase